MYLLNIKSLRLFIWMSGFLTTFLVIYYIYISNYNKNQMKHNERKINFLSMQQRVPHYLDGNGRNVNQKQQQKEILKSINEMTLPIVPERYDEKIVKNRVIREKVKLLTEQVPDAIEINRDVLTMDEDMLIHNRTVSHMQVFYYLPVKWFKADNQSTIPQSNTAFFPRNGLYNFSTILLASKIIKTHLNEIRLCGVGVIVLTWEPNNKELNELMPLLFRLIDEMNDIYKNSTIKITIQIDDYEDRTLESIRNNIKFFVDNYNSNSNLLKVHSTKKNKTRPLFYIKFAEQIKEWSKLLGKNGLITIRDTIYDSMIVAHLETKESKSIIRRSHFDGFYSFNVSNGATYFSTWKNWEKLKKFAEMYNLLFVPTVGPGFYDASPKYSALRRFRSNGQYFEIALKTAILQNPEFITIESYNNWIDGTQIEQATPHKHFRDYEPHAPIKYLQITQHWVNQFYKIKVENQRHHANGQLCEHLLNNTIC
ncbi:unnamed protein product [Diamesa serratosioi]